MAMEPSSPVPGKAVLVRYFAMLRERRGLDHETVVVLPGETAGALYARLFPVEFAGGLPVGFAVDHAYVGAEHVLQPGQELVFIPPVGGG